LRAYCGKIRLPSGSAGKMLDGISYGCQITDLDSGPVYMHNNLCTFDTLRLSKSVSS